MKEQLTINYETGYSQAKILERTYFYLRNENQRFSVKESDLPVVLPEVESYLPTDDGSSPIARNKEWTEVEIDGKIYSRETNTMPQWAGSCWYYLRYLDQITKKNLLMKIKLNIGCQLTYI